MNSWQESVKNRPQLDAHDLDLRGEIRTTRSVIDTQFRWMPGVLAALFAARLGPIAKGFGWL
jgi:hypothetical protein